MSSLVLMEEKLPSTICTNVHKKPHGHIFLTIHTVCNQYFLKILIQNARLQIKLIDLPDIDQSHLQVAQVMLVMNFPGDPSL